MLKASIRLKEFIDDLGLSVDGFRVQCGIKSSATMAGIINDGKRPSDKTLQKIIKRYPQLSKDWIETGVGEMYLDQFTKHNNSSTGALQASRASQFSSIEQSLMNHDFAISELTKMVQKALLKNHEDINRAFATLGKMAQQVLDFKDWAEEKEVNRNNRFNKIKDEHLAQIQKNDQDRRKWMEKNDQERRNWIKKNDQDRRNWMVENDQVRKQWMETKHQENKDWTEDKLNKNENYLAKMKEEIFFHLSENTSKAIKEIGQLSINSKPQK